MELKAIAILTTSERLNFLLLILHGIERPVEEGVPNTRGLGTVNPPWNWKWHDRLWQNCQTEEEVNPPWNWKLTSFLNLT